MTFGAVRFHLLLVATLLGAACSDDGKLRRQQRAGEAPDCAMAGVKACRNADGCAAGETCSESCCLPACASDADCADCGPRGCVCDEGACRERACSAHAECDGEQVCIAGACTAPPAVVASSCTVEPRWAVVREGAPLSLTVRASDGAGRPIVIPGAVAWSSRDPARATVDADGVVRGGEAPGETEIEAAVGDVRCAAAVVNHPAPEAGAVRVVVIDELTGLPIEGAQVQVETGATPLTGATDAAGAALFAADLVPGPPRTISAFHPSYAWLTVAGVAATDLLLPLRRLAPVDRAGGVRGTFGPDTLFHPDFVHAGVAGTSIPGNLIDLSFSILIGPARLTTVTIGSERKVKIPSGVVLGLGNTWFKESFQALGEAGACADRARSAAGACAVRTAWGVAGGVPLLDLPIDEITEGGEALSPGELLAELLPHFGRFRSAVARDVAFDFLPRVGGAPDWDRFTPANLEATARLALRSTVALPPLPGAGMDGAIVFGGADVAERGVVPLGLTAGVDARAGESPDGRIDDLVLRIAPLHGGLEGSDYVVVALAADFTAAMADDGVCTAADRSGCAAIAGLIDRSARFPFGRRIDFSAGPGFVRPAVDASWDPASRTFVPDPAAGGANVLRVKLSAGDGKVWHAWMPADLGSFTFPVPAGMEDRAANARATAQLLRLTVDLEALVSFDGTRLDRAGPLLEAFSTIDLPR